MTSFHSKHGLFAVRLLFLFCEVVTLSGWCGQVIFVNPAGEMCCRQCQLCVNDCVCKCSECDKPYRLRCDADDENDEHDENDENSVPNFDYEFTSLSYFICQCTNAPSDAKASDPASRYKRKRPSSSEKKESSHDHGFFGDHDYGVMNTYGQAQITKYFKSAPLNQYDQGLADEVATILECTETLEASPEEVYVTHSTGLLDTLWVLHPHDAFDNHFRCSSSNSEDNDLRGSPGAIVRGAFHNLEDILLSLPSGVSCHAELDKNNLCGAVDEISINDGLYVLLVANEGQPERLFMISSSSQKVWVIFQGLGCCDACKSEHSLHEVVGNECSLKSLNQKIDDLREWNQCYLYQLRNQPLSCNNVAAQRCCIPVSVITNLPLVCQVIEKPACEVGLTQDHVGNIRRVIRQHFRDCIMPVLLSGLDLEMTRSMSVQCLSSYKVASPQYQLPCLGVHFDLQEKIDHESPLGGLVQGEYLLVVPSSVMVSGAGLLIVNVGLNNQVFLSLVLSNANNRAPLAFDSTKCSMSRFITMMNDLIKQLKTSVSIYKRAQYMGLEPLDGQR